MYERWRNVVLAAVVAQIPFEFRFTLFGLSNLQWAFVLLAVISIPALLKNLSRLGKDRLVQAAVVFVSIQWLAALYGSEFHSNAVKAAIRFTAGLLLLAIARISDDRKGIVRVWRFAAGVAAAYALMVYAGMGSGSPFRAEEFYIGQIQRLSGTFEYPNTAAAYFAMSLPIIWWSSLKAVFKWGIVFLSWCAIVLTLSLGGLLAVLLVVFAAAFLGREREERWRTVVGLVSIGILAYVVLLPVNPYLVDRVYGPTARSPIGAEYKIAWNDIQQQPNAPDQVLLEVTNSGISNWPSSGRRRIAVGARWWSSATQKFLRAWPFTTELPHDVRRGEVIEIPIAIRTPDQPGQYVLVVELYGGNLDWFSRTGVKPVLIQADIRPGASRITENTDLSVLYQKAQVPGRLTAAVPRSLLWKAALKMAFQHPFGVGPDNFRLEYGKYLNASSWDKTIYSNNLYLEILTGSGVLGLAAFGVMIAFIPWRLEPACLAIAIFLVHGLVDVFIMATPIYFAFWILTGTVSSEQTALS